MSDPAANLEIVCKDGPAKGRPIKGGYPTVFCEMGSCCGEWSHSSMRDILYDGEGNFIRYGEWTYWQWTPDGDKPMDAPAHPNHYITIGEMPRV